MFLLYKENQMHCLYITYGIFCALSYIIHFIILPIINCSNMPFKKYPNIMDKYRYPISGRKQEII